MTWVKLDDKMLGHPRIASVEWARVRRARRRDHLLRPAPHRRGSVPRGAVGLLPEGPPRGRVLDHGMHGDDATVLAVIEVGSAGLREP